MLTGEKLVAIVPWQEVMRESEMFVLRYYQAVQNADCWRASVSIVLLTKVSLLCLLFVA